MQRKAEARAPSLPDPHQERGRLDSWKEIAVYLRRGARTVQRWEREEGLPVHRLPHDKLGSVYAFKDELDNWFARRAARAESAAALTPPSVAVLPFSDLSQERDQAWFCDGIAEEIATSLSRIPRLKAASRASSFRFRDAAIPSRDIGRELGVRSLLQGSVRKAGDRLRIAVQLVDAETGFQLWAEHYDGALGDIFAVQDEIARRVAEALEVKLAAPRPATADIDAYECYLRGRKFYYEYTAKAIECAIRMFVRAIERDPNYAQAYAGLADCWSYLYLYSDRCQEVKDQAEWASLKAWQLDPESAQALASRGLWLSLGGRVDEADRAFGEAVRLDAALFEAHYFRARHAFALGRLDEAAASYARAMEAQPDDYQSPLLAAQVEESLGRADRAAALRRRGIGIAERRLQAQPDDARALYMAANGLAALGEAGRSRRLAERALAVGPDDPMLQYNVGCVFSMLGMKDEALDLLEKAARSGLTQRGWYENDSNLDPVRGEPRFESLLRQLP